MEAHSLMFLGGDLPGRHQPALPAPPPPASTRLPSAALAAKLLNAAGGTLGAVHIRELDEHLPYGTLVVHGQQGEQEVRAGIGDALALAHQQHCPVLATDQIFAERGVDVPAGEPVEELLIRQAGLPLSARMPDAPRMADPQNLGFDSGLEHWSLRGSFLHDQTGRHWQDYACGTIPDGPGDGDTSGFLKSQVDNPKGFADLRQAVLADQYRGRRVRLSADIKAIGVSGRAGIYLRVIDPARSRRPEEREQLSISDTPVWTRGHTEVDVPADSVFVLFGITLTGPGQICATNVRLEPV
jgi:hypothetical protein